MSVSLLPNGKQQFIDINGLPLVNGSVAFYIPNTLVPKNTWQDPQQSALNTNPVILDSRGQAIIWGSGSYRQIVKDALGNTIWDEPTSDAIGSTALANIAALRAYVPPSTVGTSTVLVDVAGYYTPADGGGGTFLITNVNPGPDNGGTIFHLNASGYYAERLYDGPVHTVWFGLLTGAGSHVTNDPIFSALSTLGQSVYVDPAPTLNPATYYYEISTAIVLANGQSYTADWGTAYIKQITTGQNCINVTGTGTLIQGIWFYVTGQLTSLLVDGGILLNGTNRAKVYNCLFSGMRGSGVSMNSATNSDIANNLFVASVVSDSDDSTQCAADVFVGYSSQFNTVRNNYFLSGNGFGVACQSITNGDTNNDNRIFGNYIDGYKIYGIMAYRVNLADTVYRTLIYGNTIKNISGSVKNASTGAYDFGSGIYIQGAEFSNVYGNDIYNTHSFARMFTPTLAPGSIGFANVGDFLCTGNLCDTDAISNIYINDGNAQGLTTGIGLIAVNDLRTSPNPVLVSQRGNLRITNNAINGATDTGITINNTGSHDDYKITGNIIENNTGGYGIHAIKCSTIKIEGNDCDGATSFGIFLDTGTVTWSISNNDLRGCMSKGIQYDSCTGVSFVSNNILVGSGGSTVYGIGAHSPAYCGPNQITGFAATFDSASTSGYPVKVHAVTTLTASLTPNTDAPVQIFPTNLTGDVVLTLSTTDAVPGLTKWRVTAPAGLGGHSMTVGGKSLTAGQWIEFDMDIAGTYRETAAGTLI